MPESTAPVCSIVGLLDDGWDGLGAAARRRIEAAASLIGAGRTLERIAPHAPSARLLNMDGALTRVPGWIEEAVLEGDAAVVLATGDPLCHGIAGFLIDKLGAARLEVLPATSTLQLAFARLKRSWQEARFVSCHGADADEWQADPRQPGPTPEHGLYRVVRAVAAYFSTKGTPGGTQ